MWLHKKKLLHISYKIFTLGSKSWLPNMAPPSRKGGNNTRCKRVALYINLMQAPHCRSITLSLSSYTVSALKRELNFCNGHHSLLFFCMQMNRAPHTPPDDESMSLNPDDFWSILFPMIWRYVSIPMAFHTVLYPSRYKYFFTQKLSLRSF